MKLFLIIFLIHSTLFAQKVINAKGNYNLRIEKSWTEEYAVNLCRENAKLNAIENVFGTAVSQSNTMLVKNENSANQTISNTVFHSVSSTLVNGEWIRTIKESRYDSIDVESYHWIKIEIEGVVREIAKIPFSPETFPASCPSNTCSTEVFNSGQSFYLHFTAPKSGFVSIYLDDGEFVQRILPYTKNENEGSFPVKGDKKYVFFYKTKEFENADEIELFTAQKLEQNRLFILFSNNEIEKPILTEDKRIDKNGFTFPRKLESLKYHEWLQKMRIFDKTLELKIIDLIIKNN